MDNLTNIGVIKDIFERHGFTFSKALGQNFIVNPSVCPKIAEMGNAKEGFGIIEIGTGIGVLTNELAKRADKVVAVEIDDRLIPILNETLSEHDNVHIINADVMKTDLAAVIEENFSGLDVAVCANLPYYITSPIIMYLLESRLPIKSVTVMVQKEAGTRLCAGMGTRECGAVTAAVRYYSEPKLLFNVSRGSFMPSPNVDSCVIRLDVHNKPPVDVSDEKFFFRTVRGGFSQRRKNLANSLSSSMGIDKSQVIEAIKAAGLTETIRPEQLSLESFAAVSNLLYKNFKGE
ncbi:MAG: 16S rRNA (adenine(1518)-N(6)/adenine(1519)-N(6))-dimethyltransferase RsmA [Huintestinicola sp.]